MIALLPGYSFMYYQGLTGMPVLLALLFSLLSFPFVSRALTAGVRNRKFYFDLGVGGILFLSACFIYPIFAFTVIPTAFIFSAFRTDSLFPKRVYLCVKFCVFYAVTALTYYITVKTSIAIAGYFGVSIYDLKIYRRHYCAAQWRYGHPTPDCDRRIKVLVILTNFKILHLLKMKQVAPARVLMMVQICVPNPLNGHLTCRRPTCPPNSVP